MCRSLLLLGITRLAPAAVKQPSEARHHAGLGKPGACRASYCQQSWQFGLHSLFAGMLFALMLNRRNRGRPTKNRTNFPSHSPGPFSIPVSAAILGGPGGCRTHVRMNTVTAILKGQPTAPPPPPPRQQRTWTHLAGALPHTLKPCIREPSTS